VAQQPVTVQGTVPASGTLRLQLPRQDRRLTYTVQQVSTKAPNVGDAAESALVLDGDQITPMTPQAGAASGEPYIDVRPGSSMYVEWTGATAGALCIATFIYDDGVK